ncbi:MAG: PSD1 and planctomycete cytochrome C domain-containing protein [Pirellulales bacterium]
MRHLFSLIAVAASFCAAVPAFAQSIPAGQLEFFERNIRPVLVKECYGCHSKDAKEVEGGLLLDTREGIRKGGEIGPAVVPGNVGQSLLIKAIKQTDDNLQMPPDKKLSAEVIANFEHWVATGAADPRDGESVVVDKYQIDMQEGRKHWAYQTTKKVEAPQVKQGDWPRTDIDRFVLAALEAKELQPVGEADRRTLLRRLSFDLTGLPPTPAEAEAFSAASSSAALEEEVDRLLNSPRFGEKWARHWLDVARYAESTGKTVNFFYPQAWRYRDYVISALNNDKPYDQFIREQLAGDLMPSDDPRIEAERTIATGFLAIGPKTLNERNGLKFELDVVDEQIDVTTQAFLGITVACARCHDHKFDPIPQADYYAIAGIFRGTATFYGTVRYINAQRATPLITLSAESGVTTAASELSERERQRVEGQLQGVRASMRNNRDGLQQFFAMGRMALLQARLDAYNDDGTPKLLAMGVRDKPATSRSESRFGQRRAFGDFTYDGMRTIGDSPIYVRGEPDQPSEALVPRGTLQVIRSEPLDIPSASSGRLEFAEWIASRENPLTARVMANRVWLQLFGRGLVPTAGDFGMAGRPPSHPELLDHLAIRFMDDGWSVKKLIKYIVMSRAYQLSSTSYTAAMEIDPDNNLLWRMQPRRLDAESLRDAMLAVSEQLDEMPPAGSAVAQAGEGPVTSFGPSPALAAVNDARNRYRSIYLPIIRDNVPEALALFDASDPSLIAVSRERTTVPSQALFLLNNDFVMRAADAAAEKLLEKENAADRIHDSFVRFFGRPPTPDEQSGAIKFIDAYQMQLTKDSVPQSRQEREAWSVFCQSLFASAEFQYRE